MRFEWPHVLLLELLLPFLALFLWWGWRRRKLVMERFADSSLHEEIVRGVEPRRRVARTLLLLGAFFFLVLAAAGPQWGMRIETLHRRGVDVVICVDVSLSMLADDMKPSRLTRAKAALKGFLQRLDGDRVAVVAFAGEAFVLCPLTLDYEAAAMFVDLLDPDLIPEPGTNLAAAVRTALGMFDEHSLKYKVIVLITDGEDHGGEALAAAKEAAGKGAVIYTIGVGSTKGQLIRIPDGKGGYTVKRGPDGQPVLSRLDEVTLQKMALITGGRYYHATKSEMELDKIARRIDAMEKRELVSRKFARYQDRCHYPLAVAFFLLLAEFYLSFGSGGRARSGTRSSSLTGPPSALTCALLSLSLALGTGAAVRADARRPSPLHASSKAAALAAEAESLAAKGDLSGALEKYLELQRTFGDAPQVWYNIGSIHLKQGKFDEAQEAFQKALGADDPALRAWTYYDMGELWYERAEKERNPDYYTKAIECFKEALRLDPSDQDSKYNIEYIRRKLKQMMKPKQQQKKQQRNQQQKQQQKQQQNRQQNQKDRQRKQRQNRQNKQNEQDEQNKRKQQQKQRQNQLKQQQKQQKEQKQQQDQKDRQRKRGQNRQDKQDEQKRRENRNRRNDRNEQKERKGSGGGSGRPQQDKGPIPRKEAERILGRLDQEEKEAMKRHYRTRGKAVEGRVLYDW